jgi:flagellar biogenesis protein FliO
MYRFFFIALLSLLSFSGFSDTKTTYISQSEIGNQKSADTPQDINNLDATFHDDFPPIEYKGAFLKMILSVIAVVVLGSITIWSFKRMAKSRVYTANQNKEIKILEKRMLSPKSILYLIEYSGKKMIVSESHLDMKIKVLDLPE